MHLARHSLFVLGLLIPIALTANNLSSSYTTNVKAKRAQSIHVMEQYDSIAIEREEYTTEYL